MEGAAAASLRGPSVTRVTAALVPARSLLARLRRALRRTVLARRRPLAAVLAAAATLGVLRVAAPPPTPMAWVTVAARDLPAGTRVAAADVTRVRVSPDAVPAGPVSEPVGATLAAPLRRGEPVTDVRVVGAGLVAGYPGRVLVPVRFADAAAADLLRPGDVIDVLVAGSRSRWATTAAAGATVVTIPTDGAPVASVTSGRLVVLALRPDEAGSVSTGQVGGYLTYVIHG